MSTLKSISIWCRNTTWPDRAYVVSARHEIHRRAHVARSRRAYLENNKTERDLSLYFHIPFCETLCWFCGCTTVITEPFAGADLHQYLEGSGPDEHFAQSAVARLCNFTGVAARPRFCRPMKSASSATSS
jgi:hypothetical protein